MEVRFYWITFGTYIILLYKKHMHVGMPQHPFNSAVYPRLCRTKAATFRLVVLISLKYFAIIRLTYRLDFHTQKSFLVGNMKKSPTYITATVFFHFWNWKKRSMSVHRVVRMSSRSRVGRVGVDASVCTVNHTLWSQIEMPS